jgi:hypothetical protein
MVEGAKVFQDREIPDQWCSNGFDDDGRCELEIFTGPDARQQALRYAQRNTRSSEKCSLSRISADDRRAADPPDGSPVTFRCLLPPVAPAPPPTELTQGLRGGR